MAIATAWPTLLPFSVACVPCRFFFFSSRRRHTRSDRDWSSDVCSSDLLPRPRVRKAAEFLPFPVLLHLVLVRPGPVQKLRRFSNPGPRQSIRAASGGRSTDRKSVV